MRIILVRHAEPDYEHDSLTTKGFREAEALGKRAADWKAEALYVSPLGRAAATAVPLEKALGKKAQTLHWLQEFRAVIDAKYGTYENIPWDFPPSFWTKIESLYDKNEWYLKPPMQKAGDKPSVQEVYQETCQGLDELLAQYGYVRQNNLYRVERHTEDTIVLVCHMGISFVMLSHLLGIPFIPLMQGFFLPPSSVSVLNSEEVEEGTAAFRCQCLGDVKHLRDGHEKISQMGYFAEVFQE